MDGRPANTSNAQKVFLPARKLGWPHDDASLVSGRRRHNRRSCANGRRSKARDGTGRLVGGFTNVGEVYCPGAWLKSVVTGLVFGSHRLPSMPTRRNRAASRRLLTAEALVVFVVLEVDYARNLLYWPQVRVRILKRMPGVIHGVSLDTLFPGLVYDLPHELAQRLIVEKVAREDHSHGVEVLIPSGDSEDDRDLIDHVTRGIRVTGALSEGIEEPVSGPPKTKR